MKALRLLLTTAQAAGDLLACAAIYAALSRLAARHRSHDPVWQAFEREPPPHRPLNAEQLHKRIRGLADMRAGRLVDVDAIISARAAVRHP